MGVHSNQVRDEIGGVGVLIVARFSTGLLRAITLVNALTSRQFIVECETTPDSQCPVKVQLSDGFRVRYHFVALNSGGRNPQFGVSGISVFRSVEMNSFHDGCLTPCEFHTPAPERKTEQQ